MTSMPPPRVLLRYVVVNAERPSDRPIILVADDDPEVLAVLEDLLVDEGYDVVTADDGREALRLAGSRPVDLILLDHTMPHLSGAAFCGAYRERGGGAPVILISAATEPAIADAVAACGAAGYISKPFDIDDVLARIAQHAPPPTPPPPPIADGSRG
jgi:DNA-binding response OmpR family regulator